MRPEGRARGRKKKKSKEEKGFSPGERTRRLGRGGRKGESFISKNLCRIALRKREGKQMNEGRKTEKIFRKKRKFGAGSQGGEN